MFVRALTTEELAERGKMARERHAERMRRAQGEVAGKKTGSSGMYSSQTPSFQLLTIVLNAVSQGKLLLLLPLNDLSQLADHYCHWFSELSFTRINVFTTGYAFTPCVGSFTSPGIDTS